MGVVVYVCCCCFVEECEGGEEEREDGESGHDALWFVLCCGVVVAWLLV